MTEFGTILREMLDSARQHGREMTHNGPDDAVEQFAQHWVETERDAYAGRLAAFNEGALRGMKDSERRKLERHLSAAESLLRHVEMHDRLPE